MGRYATLEELLAKAAPKSEEEYRALDPMYVAGIKASKMALPEAQTSNQAFLGPILQGLIGGSLQEYGRDRATDTAYQDYRKSIGPALAGYESEETPEGWSAKTGQQDLIGKMLAEQKAEEANQLKTEVAKGTIQRLIAAGDNAGAEAVAKNLMGTSLGLEGLPKPPPTAQDQIASLNLQLKQKQLEDANADPITKIGEKQLTDWSTVAAVTTRADNLVTRLEKLKPSYGSLQGARLASALDKEGLGAEMADLADKFLRTRTGASAPEQEQNKLLKIAGGDFSAGYETAMNLLRKFSERAKEDVIAQTKVRDAYRAGNTDAVRTLFGSNMATTQEAAPPTPSTGFNPNAELTADQLQFVQGLKSRGMGAAEIKQLLLKKYGG